MIGMAFSVRNVHLLVEEYSLYEHGTMDTTLYFEARKKERHWLCTRCSGGVRPFHLAGILKRCYLCNRYACGFFEKVGQKWLPAIISTVNL